VGSSLTKRTEVRSPAILITSPDVKKWKLQWDLIDCKLKKGLRNNGHNFIQIESKSSNEVVMISVEEKAIFQQWINVLVASTQSKEGQAASSSPKKMMMGGTSVSGSTNAMDTSMMSAVKRKIANKFSKVSGAVQEDF
jgi:hypothetical protein